MSVYSVDDSYIISQKQHCPEFPLFLFSLHHMMELVHILYILLLYPDLLAMVFYSWVQVRNMGAVEKSDVSTAISYHEKRLLKKAFNAWYFTQVS